MQPIERCLYRVYSLSSRVVSATLNQVVEHLVAALDDVRLQTALDLGNLVIVFVADTTVSNLAGGTESLECLLADAQVLTRNLAINPLLVYVACLL